MTINKLKAVKPKAAKLKKPVVLIYGKPGVGKTWASLDFPNVYYIDTEGGANLAHYIEKLEASDGAYFGVEQGSLDFEEIIGQVIALATTEHPYKTLVIDSLTKVHNHEITKEAERLADIEKRTGKDTNSFNQDRKPAYAYTRRLINWLNKLDMNVILVAHEEDKWDKGKHVGATFDAWKKLEHELHLCLNIIKAGANRLYRVHKSRLTGFPEGTTAKWSYEDFATAYGKDIIEEDVTQLELATEEQLSELNNLLDVVQLPDNWLKKCLTKGKADNISELPKAYVDKMIENIKTKFLPIN